jgi:threonine aldolase
MAAPIDFRSDTLTAPDAAMRQAMANAEVGDDVFVEDPSVNELERYTAELLGKERGLFVPSGTMSNLIAMMIHGQKLFSEIMVGDVSHTSCFEVGNASIVGRALLRQLPTNDDGTIDIAVIKRSIQTTNVHNTTTRCLVLENTHNAKGGRVLPLGYLKEVADVCSEHNIKMHCDGARIWNAAIALGVEPKDLLEHFDTASVCMSKGLGAPLGSVLVGSAEFIAEARRARKMLGGGMRQAGVIAAACLYALKHLYARIADDHFMAKTLAEGVAEIGLPVLPVETNIVIWQVNPADRAAFIDKCAERGLKVIAMGPLGNVRAIPHYGNTMADVKAALDIIRDIVNAQ